MPNKFSFPVQDYGNLRQAIGSSQNSKFQPQNHDVPSPDSGTTEANIIGISILTPHHAIGGNALRMVGVYILTL